MIKFKNIIARIKNKKNMKWVLMFLVLGILFVGKTYAADGEISGIDWVSKVLSLVLSLASWVWIIFANLAGKLMTNDLVYGSFLHLDASLWTLWNIIKNFANFALGFMVLFAIVKSIFSINSGSGEWKPLPVIKKTLIAGVLIQMSWFLLGAVIDVSTIMTSAIAAFPSQFMASSDEFKGHFNDNLRELPKGKLKFDAKNESDIVQREPYPESPFADMTDDELNGVIDTLMPGHDSMSGPLIFLGLSVFNFNDIEKHSGSMDSESDITDWGDLFLDLGLSAIVLIFFTLMMFLIFLFNLFRILMLWIIIPLMPAIILLKVFKIEKIGDLGFLSEILKVSNIIKLIFKPVLMVGALSIVMVILILIDGVINKDDIASIPLTSDGNVMIETVKQPGGELYDSTIKSEGIMEFSMGSVKDGFADLIVYFLGLFLIFFVVKMAVSFKTGIGFIDKSLDNIFDGFKKIAATIPVVPMPGGGSVGFGAFNENGADFSNAAMRLTGMDQELQRQYDVLGIGDSNPFENYSTTHTNKNDFISEAVGYAKESGKYNTPEALWDDPNLSKEIGAWNKGKGENDKINEEDLEKAWKAEKKPEKEDSE
ncbi:MAG TPA: hypothetical protein VJ892_00655 [Candidatus Absconditabacterales bacterium]|nr:hypothetical protein [Candidatus Absconditabacterales bacterium]